MFVSGRIARSGADRGGGGRPEEGRISFSAFFFYFYAAYRANKSASEFPRVRVTHAVLHMSKRSTPAVSSGFKKKQTIFDLAESGRPGHLVIFLLVFASSLAL